jgi:hypothetical protein
MFSLGNRGVVMLTLSQLKFEMRDYAAVFSNKKVDDNKPLKIYLSNAGSGTATPRHIFKAFIKYILESNGHTLRPWPGDWADKSINTFAPWLL